MPGEGAGRGKESPEKKVKEEKKGKKDKKAKKEEKKAAKKAVCSPLPQSSEYGTYKTMTTRFGPRISGQCP